MKTLIVSLADIEDVAHGSMAASTIARVHVSYTGPVVLTDGKVIPRVVKDRGVPATGEVSFSVHASDDPLVAVEYQGFAVKVEVRVEDSRSGRVVGRWETTVKPLEAMASPISLGTLDPAEPLPPQWASVGELVDDVNAAKAAAQAAEANVGPAAEAAAAPAVAAAQSAQADAAGSRTASEAAATRAENAEAAAYEIPDEAWADMADNPASSTRETLLRVAAVGTTVRDIRNSSSWDPVAADHSAAVIEAAGTTGPREVRIPAGDFTVQGLPLRDGLTYRGEGQGATRLHLPAAATAPMFRTVGDFALNSGGIYAMELDGGGAAFGVGATQNGIDFSSLQHLYVFRIKECYVHGFTTAVHGSAGGTAGDDRWLFIDDTLIWENQVGLYTNEHSQLKGVDFRSNDIGTTGRLNDFSYIGTKWAYNRIGVQPDADGWLGGDVAAGKFTGCIWYRNSELGIELTNGSQIVGGEVDGNGAGSVGIRIDSPVWPSRVIGVTFNQSAPSECETDIEIVGAAGGDVYNCFHRKYTAGFTAIKAHTNGVGIFNGRYRLQGGTTAISLGASPRFQMHVLGNNVDISHGASRFIDHAAGFDGRIHSNHIIVNAALTGPALRLAANANNRASIHANTARPHNVGAGVAFDVDVRNQGRFTNNESLGALTTVINSYDATSTIGSNHGYKTRAAGVVTILAGATEATVTHDLSRAPTAAQKMVTPTTDLGTASRFWVGPSVTGTQFKVFVNAAPGVAVTFAWQCDLTA